MTDILATAPKYFRAPVSRGGDPRVDRTGGYRGAGLIRGVSVISKGEALGHGLWIDDTTLEQVESLVNANKLGTKSRFTHGTMSGDALGKHVGRIMDAEVDGDQVFADQHFVPSAHKSPDGDLAEYLMSLAEDDPTAYGISIAFLHDESAMDQFVAAHSVDGEFRSPDPNNLNNYPHVRILEIHSADSVDSPAANSGLFHREGDIARDAEAFVSYALGRTNERPESHFGLDPDRARGFMARFFDTHNLEIKEKVMANDKVEESTDLTADSTADVAVETTVADDNAQQVTEPVAEPDHTEAKRFRAAFGDQGLVWHFGEGLSFDECRERQLAELKREVDSLKTKLAARPLDGEDTPVSFDAGDQKTRNGFASNYRIK